MKFLVILLPVVFVVGFMAYTINHVSTIRKQNNCLHGALIAVHAMENSTMDLTFNPSAVFVEIDNGCREYSGLKPQ